MTQCPNSPDRLHHYKVSGTQHLVMNHCDYICVFCNKSKCVHIFPDEPNLLNLPTDKDLDSR